MKRTALSTAMRRVWLAAAALAIMTTGVFAHAVVYPAKSAAGAYERYVLRVPNERDQPTTRVEIRFPPAVRVVSFADVPGWRVEVVKDSAQRIIAAVWTGTLPPERFVELPFIAVNPKEAADIVWPAFQTYGDGEVVAWEGAPGSERPASVTKVGAADAATAPAAGETAEEEGDDGLEFALTAGALILSLIAIGLAVRKTPE